MQASDVRRLGSEHAPTLAQLASADVASGDEAGWPTPDATASSGPALALSARRLSCL